MRNSVFLKNNFSKFTSEVQPVCFLNMCLLLPDLSLMFLIYLFLILKKCVFCDTDGKERLLQFFTCDDISIISNTFLS